jgi:hypothetical protein
MYPCVQNNNEMTNYVRMYDFEHLLFKFIKNVYLTLRRYLQRFGSVLLYI